MDKSGVLEKSLQMGRAVASINPTLERLLRDQYRTLKSTFKKRVQGGNYIYFRAGKPKHEPVGIFLRGGCDVAAAFACEPLIQTVLNGTCCIYRSGIGASSTHTDLLLQSLEKIPESYTAETCKKLEISPSYFKPVLFRESFAVPAINGMEELPKTVVVLSIGPDFARTLYRHREHGFLVDPGGWWLNQSMSNVIKDDSNVMWFSKNFKKVGRITVERSMANFSRIIELVRQRTGAQIMMFNLLGVEPKDETYNYRYRQNSNMMRRREFNLALYDLSRQLDFSIIDVDRILKREGVEEQVDFAHWPIDRFKPVAEEMFTIFQEREIF